MLRRPPRSTRTYTLFPYTTLFRSWKEFIKDWLPNRNVVRTRRDLSCFAFFTLIVPRLLMARQPEVYVWGFKAPTYVAFFCQRFEIPLIRVEDGFIRSVALGASKAPPPSLCMDSSDERRVGKECVSTFSPWLSPYP